MMVSKVWIPTSVAMIAFAGNSLLCRIALRHTHIDPSTFTSIRVLSGLIALWLIVALSKRYRAPSGNWISAFALFVYAAAFSFAYVNLSAGMGALLLFGAVQATMILTGVWHGERLNGWQGIGLVLALGGLVILLFPGLSAPPALNALLMVAAGVAWGVYSLRGRGAGDALQATAGNFLRALPFAAALNLLVLRTASVDTPGIAYAIASGALTSGVGYAIWYAALPRLKATTAATVQLSVPVLAALGGVALLGEPVTMRLFGASIAVLGGIALVVMCLKPGTAT